MPWNGLSAHRARGVAHAEPTEAGERGIRMFGNQTVENGITPGTDDGQSRSMDGSGRTFTKEEALVSRSVTATKLRTR